MTSEFQGVILAAGKGSRIRPFSENSPKPLLPILNRPIMEYQIRTMVEAGITDIMVVIGHLGVEIARVIGDGTRFGARITYVDQPSLLGIAHALGQLERHITRPFLLFLGDIFFLPTDMSPLMGALKDQKADAVLATKIEASHDAIKRNYAVICHEGTNRVKRVVEKPRYIENNLKGCGLYLFTLPVFDAIRRTPRTAIRDEYEITDSIQMFIDDGYHVTHLPLVEEDLNLTFASDLHEINLYELKRQGLPFLLGENIRLPPGTEVDNSVVGDNVVFHHPIRVQDSVIFAGSVITQSTPLEGMIVTPERMVPARGES
ncbi:MAG: sugar phosphate nucleotidyltransferase [Deltaproteobacteria bacterium]|nr:sugar phosphate nucleotidyltransferase [Deltaproteobacteria bacterium]